MIIVAFKFLFCVVLSHCKSCQMLAIKYLYDYANHMAKHHPTWQHWKLKSCCPMSTKAENVGKQGHFDLEHVNIHNIEVRRFNKLALEIPKFRCRYKGSTSVKYKMNNRSHEIMSSNDYQQTSPTWWIVLKFQ